MDGRSRLAKRYAALVHKIVTDLGGADGLSEVEKSLVQRASFTVLQIEMIEAKALGGTPLNSIDFERHGSLTDRFRRLAQVIGLERRTKSVDTLADYIRRKSRE